MGIIDSVCKRVYAPEGNTIADYIKCLGVNYTARDTLRGFQQEYLATVRTSYPKLLLMLRQENSPALPSLLNDLEFLHKIVTNMFLNFETDPEAIILSNMLLSEKKFTIPLLRSALDLFTLTAMKKVRSMPSNYFDLISPVVKRGSDKGVSVQHVSSQSLPVSKLSKCDYTERIILSKGNQLYSCGPSAEVMSNIYTYSSSLDLGVLKMRLASSVSRARTNKDIKLQNVKILNELLTRSKLKPLDVLVLPEAVGGSLLRGQLTVKFKIGEKAYEDNIPLDNLVYSEGTTKIYKSNISLNTPLGKREVYVAYYAV